MGKYLKRENYPATRNDFETTEGKDWPIRKIRLSVILIKLILTEIEIPIKFTNRGIGEI